MVAHNSPLLPLLPDPVPPSIMLQGSPEFQQTWQLKFLAAGERMPLPMLLHRKHPSSPGIYFSWALTPSPDVLLCLPSRNGKGWRMTVGGRSRKQQRSLSANDVSTAVTGKMHSVSSSDLCRAMRALSCVKQLERFFFPPSLWMQSEWISTWKKF